MTSSIILVRPGRLTYDEAWAWQRETSRQVREGADDVLALLEHPPVYTFGRLARYEHLLVDSEDLRLRGAELIESDRGGDVTFHGPGQIVGYPIIDLRRRSLGPNDYVRCLEETLIRTLDAFGVVGERSPGRPGVWVGGAKIGAIGVRVVGGVTMHGFALNVETDLAWFDAIVPCGIADAGMTSLERVLGDSPGLPAVEATIIESFCDVLDVSVSDSSPALVGAW